MALKHLRSSTANKRPLPTGLADGQLAINTEQTSPGLFFKNASGSLVKVGPVHVGTAAPNATPASGGEAGNSIGEQWLDTSGANPVLKIWDGSTWQSEAGEFVNASGDTMTGALVMDNQQQVRFRETTANGTNFIAIQAPASVAADRTLTLPDVDGTIVSTGDTGTVTSTMIADGTIVNADINASAAIVDTKLATIATAGKVSNSATTAASANTANAIVARDASGNFSAGTITANLTGTASAIADSTVTSAKIVDGTIVNADVNASAAIAGTKISPDFGSQAITTSGLLQANGGYNILKGFNRRPPLHRGPLFTKTAATTLSVVADCSLNGFFYASATAVTMGSHTDNTDMAIWQHPTTGALVSDASFTTAPAGATGGSIVAGYHYIPSGRPTAFNNGSPTAAAEILEYSIWDLTWRPECPDPRGMSCIDGRFWADLYLCGSTSYAGADFSAVPSSKIGLTIADNSSPPLIPGFYGGDGSTAYTLVSGNNPGSWYNFSEVAHSFGKRLMWSWEFQAAAFGAPEAGSRGSDPGTVIWERESKWGLAQATGTLVVWGIERVGIYTSGTNTNTGGRGTEFADAPRAVRLGGSWVSGADSGSRSANWGDGPSIGLAGIGARFAAGHLTLG